jgi:predicted deacylase
MCDLVIDLHEEGPAWPEAEVPTLVITPASASLAMDLLDALRSRGLAFAFTSGAPEGSLVGELGKRGRAALSIEVPARLPETERVELLLAALGEALRILGSPP